MALLAVFFYGEGVLAIMAAAAGVPRLQSGHAEMLHPCLEGKTLAVAVDALVHIEVEFVTELDLPAIGLEADDPRFETLVTTVAVAGRGKGVLIVVTGAT